MVKTSSTTTAGTVSSTPTELDLAFIIDATRSMGSYIKSAQENMRNIIQDIITSERCLLNAALILYRDHPPQEDSFVIKVNDFTNNAEQAKANIDLASACGGGDIPEAMAPALHAAVHTLSWRKNAVKIAILIADAPPHGLESIGDSWPNGDPSGHDPIECVALLAERGITLYTIGCEPEVMPYRDFFMALAFKTGGQYIPLANSANLSSVIVGSAQEEISLERLIAQVHEEVMREAALRGGPIDEAELTRRLHEVMHSGGVKARRLKMDNQDRTTSIPSITSAAEQLSTLTTLKEVREKWASMTRIPITPAATTAFVGLLGLGKIKASVPVPVKKRRTHLSAVKKTPVKRLTAAKVETTTKKETSTNHKAKEEVSTDNDAMEISTPTVLPAEKPLKIKTETSNINLGDDELLDVSQTRRLVCKCVARNKLKST